MGGRLVSLDLGGVKEACAEMVRREWSQASRGLSLQAPGGVWETSPPCSLWFTDTLTWDPHKPLLPGHLGAGGAGVRPGLRKVMQEPRAPESGPFHWHSASGNSAKRPLEWGLWGVTLGTAALC